MDVRQTSSYAAYLKKISWKIEQNPSTKNFYFIRQLPLIPVSILKIQRPNSPIDFDFMETLIKKYHVIQSNIELLGDVRIPVLGLHKYRRSKVSFLPTSTLLIDLSLSDKKLLSLMKSKARYNIGLSTRKGVTMKIFDGEKLLANNAALFEDIYHMQKQNAQRLKIFSPPRKWFYDQVTAFGIKCFAVMAYSKDTLLAGAYFLASDEGIYYSHNGSTVKGRAYMAPIACVWRGMLEGKKRGLKVFDFEGVYDPRSNDLRWKGFTRFKKGLGGQVKMYPGLYTKWHMP